MNPLVYNLISMGIMHHIEMAIKLQIYRRLATRHVTVLILIFFIISIITGCP